MGRAVLIQFSFFLSMKRNVHLHHTSLYLLHIRVFIHSGSRGIVVDVFLQLGGYRRVLC